MLLLLLLLLRITMLVLPPLPLPPLLQPEDRDLWVVNSGADLAKKLSGKASGSGSGRGRKAAGSGKGKEKSAAKAASGKRKRRAEDEDDEEDEEGEEDVEEEEEDEGGDAFVEAQGGGGGATSGGVPRDRLHVCITTYDLVQKMGDAAKEYGAIICDESHALKSRDAKRTKCVDALVRRCKRAVLLTGTPVLSRPVEAFPQVDMLKPGLLGSFWAFAGRYCASPQDVKARQSGSPVAYDPRNQHRCVLRSFLSC